MNLTLFDHETVDGDQTVGAKGDEAVSERVQNQDLSVGLFHFGKIVCQPSLFWVNSDLKTSNKETKIRC